jgi:hypothetical protein
MGRGGGGRGGGRDKIVRQADSYRESKPDVPTAFKSKEKDDGSGKTNTYFNTPDQGRVHGDVAESQRSDGQTQYHYVRDNEGNEAYAKRSLKKWSARTALNAVA